MVKVCSVCDFEKRVLSRNSYKYCPHCGAKMNVKLNRLVESTISIDTEIVEEEVVADSYECFDGVDAIEEVVEVIEDCCYDDTCYDDCYYD